MPTHDAPAGFSPPPTDTTRPTLSGNFGMAASTHWLATATAQSVLERGGNAADAAVAAGFVLHVVEPHLNGPAGDLVGLINGSDAPPRVLVGQGPAPAGASIEEFTSRGITEVPGAGALAAAVPGAVPAWLHLLAGRGTWDITEVLHYAIDIAERGHPAGPGLTAVIGRMSDHFTEHWPASAAIWLPDGQVPQPGDTIRMPGYAATLRRLLTDADHAAPRPDPDAPPGRAGRKGDRLARIEAVRRSWQQGWVAQALAAAAAGPHRHSDGHDHAGVITVADQAEFAVTEEDPVHLDFRGMRIFKAGAWSQGPVLLQALAILDHFDDDRLDPSTELGAHTVIEVLKLALADRDAYYGSHADPEVVAALLSREYAAERAALVTERASTQWRPGQLPGITRWTPPTAGTTDQPEAPSSPATGEPTVRPDGVTRGDTCHLDVIDEAGNMIAVTPSGGWLQSNPAVPELGFPLGTRLQMTWLDPASPSRLAPGHRPRTTLSPTIFATAELFSATMESRRYRMASEVEAVGTPGGDQQDQWQLLYLLRRLVGGYSPQQAIDAPALHTTAMISSFWPRTRSAAGVIAESRLGEDVIAGLRRRGHEVTVAEPWSLGRLSAIRRSGKGPGQLTFLAAANSRGGQGYASGR